VTLLGDHVVEKSPVHADALERAARTLWTGIGVDAAVAIGSGVLIEMQGGDVTSPAFWAAIGGLVVKSILTASASYLVRLKVEPKATDGSSTDLQ
jgi:hypothetical protein